MKNEGTRLLIENFTLGVTNGDSTSSSKAYLASVIGYMVIPSIFSSESSIASTAVLGLVILFFPLLMRVFLFIKLSVFPDIAARGFTCSVTAATDIAAIYF